MVTRISLKTFGLLALVLPQLLLANVKLNTLFSDHMVIQRETEIPIWGWADPNENVEVITSWGESAKTVTDANGNWRVDLKTPKAGGPFTITVSANNTIVINDVLSGDVWLCTGQSNMDFAMSKFVNDSREPQYQTLVEYIRNEVSTVNDDWIRHIEVPQTTSLYEKKLNFKDNWRSANPEQIGKITATGYFFAKEIRKHINVPIGLLECAWGGTRIQPWISEESYVSDQNLKDYFKASSLETKAKTNKMDAKDYVDEAYQKALTIWENKGKKGKKPKPPTDPRQDKQQPATLYNGMLSTIIPYSIKGAIWYQGESNAVFKPTEYEYYLTTMIKNWRTDWNQGDFPFYYVQLAACRRGNDEADKGWATVNDQLRRALKVQNTGMAVLYDIGEGSDIHPHNKMDAGKRMAFWALEQDYHLKIDAKSGPLYKSNKAKRNKIQIKFTEVGSGLMVGHKHLMDDTVSLNEPLKWFEILGNDGQWKTAEAKIISKNTIEVWNTSVSKPIHVRYAWSGYPDGANLYNKEGLPAGVFNTNNN